MFRILIVEDNPVFRGLLKEMLQLRFPSTEVRETGNAKHALRQVEARTPDLIFMDIKLPGETGLDLARKVKARFPRIVVIVLTSFDLPEYREVARDIGVDRFLSKDSTSLEDMAGIIETLLSKRRVGVKDADNP